MEPFMQAKRSNAFRTVVSEVSFIDAIELLQYWKREHLKGVETDAPPQVKPMLYTS